MIKRAIVTDPNFQVNGKFDNGIYQQVLQQNRLNVMMVMQLFCVAH